MAKSHKVLVKLHTILRGFNPSLGSELERFGENARIVMVVIICHANWRFGRYDPLLVHNGFMGDAWKTRHHAGQSHAFLDACIL